MEVGDLLRDRYRLEKLLGRGGMAEVWKAYDLRRSAYVAIKLMREDLAEDPEFLRRFEREAEAHSQLDHPNIVRFYSFGRQGAVAYIVMDYVPGVTLRRHLLDAGGPLPLPEALSIMRQVCAALQYAHEEGFVHRDIKPGNIMLREDGTALLTDFGIAKAIESATVTTFAIGAPAYMSPEQIMGSEVDRRSDVYSLGVTLYEMVAGRRPFSGEQGTGLTTMERLRDAHLHTAPPDPRQYNPALPEQLALVILRALSKDRADRWPSASAFSQALGDVMPAQLAVPARAPMPQAAVARTDIAEEGPVQGAMGTARRSRAALAAGGIATLGLVVLALTVRACLPPPPDPATPVRNTLPLVAPSLSPTDALTASTEPSVTPFSRPSQMLTRPTARATPRPSATATGRATAALTRTCTLTATPMLPTATAIQRAATQTPSRTGTATSTPQAVPPTDTPAPTSTPTPPPTAEPTRTATPTAVRTATAAPGTTVTIEGLPPEKLKCLTLVFRQSGREVGRTAVGTATTLKGPTCDEVLVEGDATGRCPWDSYSLVQNPVRVSGNRALVRFTAVGPSPGWTPEP